MLVVSDATPVNVLVRIDLVHVLGALYGRVVIPPAVRAELTAARTPKVVKTWIAAPPTWLEVTPPRSTAFDPELDPGEAQAIVLARELAADLLLVDDLQARKAAKAAGLEITGTVGVLVEASRRGLVEIEPAMEKLRRTDFRVSESLLNEAIRLATR